MRNRYDAGEILWRENMTRLAAAESARLLREGAILFLVSAVTSGIVGWCAMAALRP